MQSRGASVNRSTPTAKAGTIAARCVPARGRWDPWFDVWLLAYLPETLHLEALGREMPDVAALGSGEITAVYSSDAEESAS